MVEIGRVNKLKVKGVRDYGAHFDCGELGDILLKHPYVPKNCQVGDELEVFIYSDREGTLRATIQEPYATAGQFAKLQVVASTASGAFLDWGLENDLFVPKSEQLDYMEKGESYVVFVFVDQETNRIRASSKLDQFLSLEPPDYEVGEEVELVIYEQTSLGYKALVNYSHGGMLYQNEVFKTLAIGQQLMGYIKNIREDLKIDLSLQQPGFQGVDDIAEDILKIITDNGGKISLTDKSPPEEIYAMFGVSKKSFKKAIGGLYKKRRIVIDPSGIKLGK